MSLLKLLNLIYMILNGVKELLHRKKVKDAIAAKDEALDKGDQRILENSLSSSDGPVSSDTYSGLSTRKRTKTED